MSITLNGTTGITTPALDNQGNLTVDGGTIKLDGNYPVGTYNVALGDAALSNGSLSGGNNTAVGYNSGANIAGGAGNTLTGSGAGVGITTGTNNSYFGVGTAAFDYNTGTANVGLGYQALYKITTASDNTAVGYQAGFSNTTFVNNTYIGRQAGQNAVGGGNTYLGNMSGVNMTSGQNNTILGSYNGNQGGLDIRTASNNIVLSDGDGNPRGVFDNSGNFLVGNIVNSRATQSGVSVRSVGEVHLNNDTTDSGVSLILCYSNYSTADQTKFEVASDGDVFSRTNSFGAFSDERLKEQITDATSQWEDIKAIEVKNYKFISETLSDEENPKFLGVIAQQVELISPSLVDVAEDDIGTKSVKYSILYMKAVKALQEAMTRIETLEAKVTALEGN